MQEDILDLIDKAYEKWNKNNYEALAIRIRPEYVKEIKKTHFQEESDDVNLTTIRGWKVVEDKNLPKNTIAFIDKKTKALEFVKLGDE